MSLKLRRPILWCCIRTPGDSRFNTAEEMSVFDVETSNMCIAHKYVHLTCLICDFNARVADQTSITNSVDRVTLHQTCSLLAHIGLCRRIFIDTFAQPDLGKCYNHMIKMKLHSVYNNNCFEFVLIILIHHVYTAESGMMKDYQ